MIIQKTSDFNADLKKLPSEIYSLYKKQEKVFVDNWLDARLHTKRLKELGGVYSFRVTRRYRVLFYFQEVSVAVFFAVGHRKDIYEQ